VPSPPFSGTHSRSTNFINQLHQTTSSNNFIKQLHQTTSSNNLVNLIMSAFKDLFDMYNKVQIMLVHQRKAYEEQQEIWRELSMLREDQAEILQEIDGYKYKEVWDDCYDELEELRQDHLESHARLLGLNEEIKQNEQLEYSLLKSLRSHIRLFFPLLCTDYNNSEDSDNPESSDVFHDFFGLEDSEGAYCTATTCKTANKVSDLEMREAQHMLEALGLEIKQDSK
jgi:hypothetical protein